MATTFVRLRFKPLLLLLSVPVTLVLIIVIFLNISISVLETRESSGDLKFVSFYNNDSIKQWGGSRTNYSIPGVDDFVQLYLSKQEALGSKFVLRDSESYNSFLNGLRSDKKNVTGLRLDFSKDRTLANLSGRSWERFYSEISQSELYDPAQDTVASLLKDLAARPIVKADSRTDFNHPTLILTLDDGAVGVFRARRYSIEVETEPDLLYFGELERHNSEIAAFHLDRALGFHRVPPTVGRRINVTKDVERSSIVIPYISPAKNHCFLIFCKQYINHLCASCGKPDIIDGSLTISLPGGYGGTFTKDEMHPWRRSYNITKTDWELNEGYCESSVKTDLKFKQGRLLLDLIDMAIFDFLTGNMDRPHYERFKDFGEDTFLLHVDNAKGFGKSKYDCVSCLAPLRQCCLIRLSTLAKLIKLYQGPDSLSHIMRTSLNSDPLAPVLVEPHLDALDRRLGKVIKVVSDCINNGRSWDDVVVDDGV